MNESMSGGIRLANGGMWYIREPKENTFFLSGYKQYLMRWMVII